MARGGKLLPGSLLDDPECSLSEIFLWTWLTFGLCLRLGLLGSHTRIVADGRAGVRGQTLPVPFTGLLGNGGRRPTGSLVPASRKTVNPGSRLPELLAADRLLGVKERFRPGEPGRKQHTYFLSRQMKRRELLEDLIEGFAGLAAGIAG